MVVTLSVMIFTTTASVLSGLNSAPAAFAGGEGFVIFETSAPTIFSSQVSDDMVPALEALPEITGTSPEIFAFSSWNGVSFVLRGVDLERFNATGPMFLRLELAEPLSQGGVDATIVGSRLLHRLGVELPYTMPIVGSYSSKMGFLRLVGSFETKTALDDEMLVTLDVARYLAGVQEGKVSVIRVATSDPEWLSDLLSPKAARFTLFDLHESNAQVAAGEPISLSVGVRNWGGRAGTTTVTFAEMDQTLASVDVKLNSSSSTTIQKSFVMQALGRHSIEVGISGDFPVKLYANFTVVAPFLKVSAPSKVLLGSQFNITVTDHTGQPASAFVSFQTQMAVSDALGRAAFTADQPGTYQVVANLSGYDDGHATVSVVDPSEFPHIFNPAVVSLSVSPATVRSSDQVRGIVVVENNGTETGSLDLVLYVDRLPYLQTNISLDAMSSATWTFTLGSLASGTHILQVGNFSQAVVVEPWYADNPGLVQLVIRYGGSNALSSSSSIPIYQAAKISQGNVAVALLAIGTIAGLLAVLAVTSVFWKEIREGKRRLGILRTIGASTSAIRRLVFPQALESGLAGSAIGLASGIIVADQLSRSGAFFLFGHEFGLEFDTGLLLLVLIGAVLISVLSALASAMLAVRETAITSIRGLEEEGQEVLNPEELLGD